MVNVFDNRILLVRVEISGTDNQSPHIRFAVTPFGGKHFRCFPAFGYQAADVGSFQWHYYFAILGAAQHGYRSFVYHRVNVYQIIHISREPGTVHPFFRSKANQVFPVEADAVIADEIRVFTGLYTICGEVNLPVFFIYTKHFAHIPFAFGDLVDGLRSGAVVHVEMVPVVAFAHPDDMLVVPQVMAEMAGVVYVFITAFLYQWTYLAGLCRKFQYPVHLMPALIVFEGYGTAVRVPFRAVYLILLGKQISGRDNTASCLHFIDARHLKWKFISRFGILLLVELRLQLVRWRRLHVIYITLLNRTYLAGSHFLAVR